MMKVEVSIDKTSVSVGDVTVNIPENIIEVEVPDEVAADLGELITRATPTVSFTVSCQKPIRDQLKAALENGEPYDQDDLADQFYSDYKRRLDAALAGRKLARAGVISKQTAQMGEQILAYAGKDGFEKWIAEFGLDGEKVMEKITELKNPKPKSDGEG